MHMRFIPAAALLAGALALAGCGGGSGVTPGSSDNDDDTPPSPSTTLPPKPTALTGTGLTNGTGEAYTIRIVKKPDGSNGTYPTPNGGTITCPSDECVITVGAQRGTPVVTVTGGATFAPKAVVEAPRGDRTAGGGEASVAWLSDRNLLNAVKMNAAGTAVQGITITDSRGIEHTLLTGSSQVGGGGNFNGDAAVHVAGTGGSTVGKVVIEAVGQEGDDTALRLIHTRGRQVTNNADDITADRDTTLSDYLVFGTWLTKTGADSGPQNDPISEILVAGSLPWKTEDLPTVGDARYEGKALGHYKRGKTGKNDPWREWDGTVELKANFTGNTNAISGTIHTGINDHDTDSSVEMVPIALDRLLLGQPGKVSGVGSGTWEAGFYGTPINGAPNGVAGSFRTERAARPAGTRVTPLPGGGTLETEQSAVVRAIVQGAFGAHHVGQLADTDQQ